MYINNTFKAKPMPTASPAWKSFGSQYKVNSTGNVQNKNAYSYTPALANLTQKPLAPALSANTTNSKSTPVPGGQSVADTYANGQAVLAQNPANLPQGQSTSVVGSTPAPATKGLVKAPTNTYSGYVGQLGDVSKTSNEQRKLQKQLQEEALKNKQIGEDARRLSEMYGSEIKDLGKLGAGAQAGDLSTGSNVVGSGNAAIASQSVSQRMQALGQAQEAALKGTSQQLTGQEQTTSALNQALGSANTQQQLGISGLGTAAGLAQPSTAGYGQTVFNPLTGQYEGGQANLDPQQSAQQLAQAVQSGQMTYEQAVQSLGYAGGAGQQFLNQALGPNFNIPQQQAQIAGQTGVLAQLPQLESADTAATGIKDKIVTYLDANPQINKSNVALANQAKQWIEGKQLTDPKYQTLFNYLNEYTNTLAPILGVGGDATNLKTEIAQSFVNGVASGQSIAEVLNNIQTLSNGKIQDIRSGATGGGVVSSPQSYGTSGGGFAETWD